MFDNPEFYRELLENLYDGVYFVDRDRRITYWNKGAERITGYRAQDVLGKRCRDNVLNHVTENGNELCSLHCPMAATMDDGKPREAEVYLRHADGHRLPVLIRAAPIRNQAGEMIGAVETFSDNTTRVTMRRRTQELQATVLLDPLTGTGNRRQIEMRIKTELGLYQETGTPFGLLFCDIDHFKTINDTHGHLIGDKTLRMVANTLRHSLRATDTMGRWGGEEFVAILNNIDRANLTTVAEKLRVLVDSSQLQIDGKCIHATISIGATLIEQGDTPEALIQRADRLMYASKQSGRNRVTLG